MRFVPYTATVRRILVPNTELSVGAAIVSALVLFQLQNPVVQPPVMEPSVRNVAPEEYFRSTSVKLQAQVRQQPALRRHPHLPRPRQAHPLLPLAQ